MVLLLQTVGSLGDWSKVACDGETELGDTSSVWSSARTGDKEGVYIRLESTPDVARGEGDNAREASQLVVGNGSVKDVAGV